MQFSEIGKVIAIMRMDRWARTIAKQKKIYMILAAMNSITIPDILPRNDSTSPDDEWL
jgi:hypothetical protein